MREDNSEDNSEDTDCGARPGGRATRARVQPAGAFPVRQLGIFDLYRWYLASGVIAWIITGSAPRHHPVPHLAIGIAVGTGFLTLLYSYVLLLPLRRLVARHPQLSLYLVAALDIAGSFAIAVIACHVAHGLLPHRLPGR